MGTSGSYGGSKRKEWTNARQEVLKLPTSGGGGGKDLPPPDDVLQDLWGAIADAFAAEDPALKKPTKPADFDTEGLMPWLGRAAGAGRGGVGGGGGVVRTGGGRQGTGSRRQVARGAARGGTVLGAAYALRAGDAAYLTELGLDLDHLNSLGPVGQCGAILEAILGEGSHPDEHALRKASLETIKEVLLGPQPPAKGDALKAFVVNYVFELSLVELQRQVNEGTLTSADVAKKEQMIRKYLTARVNKLPVPDGVMEPADLRHRATELTKEAIKILRAREEGAL